MQAVGWRQLVYPYPILRKTLNKSRISVTLMAQWDPQNNAVWLLSALKRDGPGSSTGTSLGGHCVSMLVLSYLWWLSIINLGSAKDFLLSHIVMGFLNLCLLAYLFLITPVIYKSVLVIKYSNNIEVYKVKSKLSTSSFPLPEVITVISLVYSFSWVFSEFAYFYKYIIFTSNSFIFSNKWGCTFRLFSTPPPTSYSSFILEMIPSQWVYGGLALALLAVHVSTI